MPTSNKIYRFFIDESGTPNPYIGGNNKGEKFFTLACAAISGPEYKEYKREFKHVYRKYNSFLSGKEIKSRYIRRSNPLNIDPHRPPEYTFYQNSNGRAIYESFCIDLKSIIIKSKFDVLSVSTDKDLAQRLYPRKNILSTLLTDLWERIWIYHYVNKIQTSIIIYDPKGSLDDQILEQSYDNFLIYGSWFISKQRLKLSKNLFHRVIPCKSEDSIGLHIADYFSYPLKRFAEEQTETPFYSSVIKPKLRKPALDVKSKKTVLMSNKISLNR